MVQTKTRDPELLLAHAKLSAAAVQDPRLGREIDATVVRELQGSLCRCREVGLSIGKPKQTKARPGS
jgi:hypothetical protein